MYTKSSIQNAPNEQFQVTRVRQPVSFKRYPAYAKQSEAALEG
jgi:hypothetical protein